MGNQQMTVVQQVCTTITTPDFKAKIAQALPPGISPDRFVRVALTAIQQNPNVANGDKTSLYNSVIRCAQDGLYPDGKQAALVMFGQQVQYMPMIGGLRSIAAKHGFRIATGVVHKNDEFDYELGVQPRKVHKPAPLDQDRGEAIGAWAEAMDEAGNVYLEVMGKQDIETVRQASRAKNGDLWTKWWGEAARKTVGRRLFKSLPLGDLDEAEERILKAVDDEYDYSAASAAQTPAQDQPATTPKGPRRPRGLDAVAAAASPPAPGHDDSVIEGEVVDRETGEVIQPDSTGEQSSATGEAAFNEF